MYRLGTDWFIPAVIGDTPVRIQVTRECLVDGLGSDGTEESARTVLAEHQLRLFAIATAKTLRERGDPIVITTADIRP
jgi:hypothetical protein